jgi:hypothetical protein
MKIVINNRHGGFGLSVQAENLFAQLSGVQIFRYRQTKYRHRDDGEQWEKVSDCDADIFCSILSKDFGESFSEWAAEHNEAFLSVSEIKRTDPKLIQIVEQLGEAANGRHAELVIVEIPEGVEWEIKEYDGLEWVAEKHRTWG